MKPLLRASCEYQTLNMLAIPAGGAGTTETKRFVCPANVIAGACITQEKRKTMFGACGGGGRATIEHENYVRKAIETGTGYPCLKTNMRINLRTHTLEEKAKPNIAPNGFDYTEDFDALQQFDIKKIFANIKCVVGKGGAQTRTLREVNWMIQGQCSVFNNSRDPNVYFANILEGDESHAHMSKFEYLLSLPENAEARKNIYVGDLLGYFDWLIRSFPSA